MFNIKRWVFLMAILSFGALMCISGNAMAASGTITSSGTSISDTNGGGGGLDVSMSPNVEIGYNIASDGSEYAINSHNSQTSTDNGIEYGIAAERAGYYQRSKSVTGWSFSAPSQTDSTAFSGWSYSGGGS